MRWIAKNRSYVLFSFFVSDLIRWVLLPKLGLPTDVFESVQTGWLLAQITIALMLIGSFGYKADSDQPGVK